MTRLGLVGGGRIAAPSGSGTTRVGWCEEPVAPPATPCCRDPLRECARCGFDSLYFLKCQVNIQAPNLVPGACDAAVCAALGSFTTVFDRSDLVLGTQNCFYQKIFHDWAICAGFSRDLVINVGYLPSFPGPGLEWRVNLEFPDLALNQWALPIEGCHHPQGLTLPLLTEGINFCTNWADSTAFIVPLAEPAVVPSSMTCTVSGGPSMFSGEVISMPLDTGNSAVLTWSGETPDIQCPQAPPGETRKLLLTMTCDPAPGVFQGLRLNALLIDQGGGPLAGEPHLCEQPCTVDCTAQFPRDIPLTADQCCSATQWPKVVDMAYEGSCDSTVGCNSRATLTFTCGPFIAFPQGGGAAAASSPGAPDSRRLIDTSLPDDLAATLKGK